MARRFVAKFITGMWRSYCHKALDEWLLCTGNYDFGYDVAAFGPVAKSIQHQRNVVCLHAPVCSSFGLSHVQKVKGNLGISPSIKYIFS